MQCEYAFPRILLRRVLQDGARILQIRRDALLRLALLRTVLVLVLVVVPVIELWPLLGKSAFNAEDRVFFTMGTKGLAWRNPPRGHSITGWKPMLH